MQDNYEKYWIPGKKQYITIIYLNRFKEGGKQRPV